MNNYECLFFLLFLILFMFFTIMYCEDSSILINRKSKNNIR